MCATNCCFGASIAAELSGCIRLRFLPGRPADLSVHDRLPEGRELLMIGTIGKRCTCRLQTSDSVVPSQCCRYTEYPARSRRQAPVASSSVAGGSLSHRNPPFPSFAWRDEPLILSP